MIDEYQPIKPLIVAIEGMDGSGKSALIRKLVPHYRGQRKIASYLMPRKRYHLWRYLAHLIDSSAPIEPLVYLHLTAAGSFRAKRLRNGIVFYDRYIDSLIVRALLLGVSEDVVNAAFRRHKRPDLTLVLKLPSAEIAKQRKRGKVSLIEQGSNRLFKGSEFTSFQQYQEAFQERLLERARLDPQKYAVIDATQALDDGVREAIKHIDSLIESTFVAENDASEPPVGTKKAAVPTG